MSEKTMDELFEDAKRLEHRIKKLEENKHWIDCEHVSLKYHEDKITTYKTTLDAVETALKKCLDSKDDDGIFESLDLITKQKETTK